MLRDAEHFKWKMGGLDGAGDAGDYIVGLVLGKSVPRPKPSVTAPTPTEVLVKENNITNRKSNSELSSEPPIDVDEMEKQEDKQTEEVAEQKAA
jgi:vacuolar protein sorting-associated protein 54